MSAGKTDLTRWNREGLDRFRYVDGNAATFLAELRGALYARFGPNWQSIAPSGEPLDDYFAEPADWGQAIARALARAVHVLGEHMDAYANEGFLATATQWESVRRLVSMLDYRPTPQASAMTPVVIHAKGLGRVSAGLGMSHSPASGGRPIHFETLEEVEVDPRWNSIRPRGWDRSEEVVEGKVLKLHGKGLSATPGEPVVVMNGQRAEAYLVRQARPLADGLEIELDRRLSVHPDAPWRAGRMQILLGPRNALRVLAPMRDAFHAMGRAGRVILTPAAEQPGEGDYVCIRLRTKAGVVWTFFRRVVRSSRAQFELNRPFEVPENVLSGTLDLAMTISTASTDNVSIEARGIVFHVPGSSWARLSRLAISHSALVDAAEPQPVADELFTLVGQHGQRAAFVVLPHSSPPERYDLRTLVDAEDWSEGQWLLPPIGEGRWTMDGSLNIRQAEEIGAAAPLTIESHADRGDRRLWIATDGRHCGWLDQPAVRKAANQTLLSGAQWSAPIRQLALSLSQTRVYTGFELAARVRGWDRNAKPLPKPPYGIPLGDDCPTFERTRAVILTRTDVDSSAFLTRGHTVPGREGPELRLTPPLPEAGGWTYANTVIHANVAVAGHGTRRPERMLGSGDATRADQVLHLDVSDVSFIADPTFPTGVRADVEVTVGGERWQQVPRRDDAGPTEPVYTVQVTEAGTLQFTFGDGQHGRRLPTGRGNVRVRFRVGAGLGGNLPAGSFTRLSSAHPLIDSVAQPLPASGGNVREDVASMRQNAPRSVLTMGRAVSLDDFGALVMQHAGVWQATARRGRSGGRFETVEVGVVAAGGAEVTTALADVLRTRLERACSPGVQVVIRGCVLRAVEVSIQVGADVDRFDPALVEASIRHDLSTQLSLARRRIGEPLYAANLYEITHRTPGVVHVEVNVGGQPMTRVDPDDALELVYLDAAALEINVQEARR